ncbi:hypothetical protein GWI33_004914 [Rhynchophorus ferrugineus]|uniref:Uncharacterized protein n=1 Tax=Rhynchophorus ferrugineus TaxID=354439 RepID=A0A834IWF6_RHYFE|nr:hypothetical protein GWI33_004914 [Rhynchophorus ferrugineus]
MNKKPIHGKNHPDDEKFLAEAKQSFGDYKLKESLDYKVDVENRETTVKHYKKLLQTRGKQYNLRHNFIQEVFNIRDYKYILIEKLKKKQQELQAISEELPDDLRQLGPNIPDFDPDEYPEEKLQVKVVLPENEMEADDTDLQNKITMIPPSGDELEKQLLCSKKYPMFKNGHFMGCSYNDDIINSPDITFDQLCDFPEDSDTSIELCLRARRLNRQLFYQKLKILDMEEQINKFNNWIYEARKARLPILIRGNFIDIYIVCLNEELQILKNAEADEDNLSQIVNNKLKELHKMEDMIDGLKAEKEDSLKKLETYKAEEAKVQEKFKIAAENNKFYDFLKKVFKKKFRPPKIKGDDESSSSSSSSSEESDYGDDAGSIDSRDFGFIKQDINVCPKGCEPALFNLTVELRTKRHEIEQNEREETRIMELAKKNIEIQNRKLGKLQSEYRECEKNLVEFRREKQKKLNTVRCTVVLHLDQIYGFNPESSDISDFLVFSRSKLSDLYKRVGLLQSEALDEQSKHDTYLTHLLRMKKDIIYMQRKAKMLKKEIVSLLKIKFGKVVDINELEMAMIQRSFQKNFVNELEEVLLKKMVYDLRIKMTDVRSLYISQLEHWQKKIVNGQIQLAKKIKDNTKRLELLAVISKEKKELARFIDTQQRRKEKIENTEVVHIKFLEDLKKLEDIVFEQNQTLQELREEIALLKSKGMAQEVLKRKAKSSESKATTVDPELKISREETMQQWIEYDEYVSDQEEYEEKEPIKTDITIPGYYSKETEDIVTDLVGNLLEDVDTELDRKSTEAMVHNILSGILKCTSVQEIIQEIIDNIPIEPTEDQRKSVEEIAEQLFDSQERPESSESMINCVNEILAETLSEIFCKDPHYLITTLVEKLLDTLPVEVMSNENVMNQIALKVKESTKDLELDKDELKKSIEKIQSAERTDILNIINEILERVYGIGIDFLYII